MGAGTVDNRERARKIAARVKERVNKGLGKGTTAAMKFIEVTVKDAMSVVAPRRKIGGNWVATSPATPGAPIRLVTGAARKGLKGFTQIVPGSKYRQILFKNEAKSRKGFRYPIFHEQKGMGARSGEHPYIKPTIMKNLKNIKRIMGREIKMEFKY